MEAVVNYQLDLFHVQEAYAKADRPLSNTELYDSVAELAGIPRGALEEKSEIGEGKAKHSKLKRQIRWYQQTLKAMNLLQRVEGERGIWALANKTKKGLHEVLGGVRLVAYSTKLGLAVWSDNRSFFTDFNEPIHLCVTSPPYPLRVTRGYGNVQEMQWVDFITRFHHPGARTYREELGSRWQCRAQCEQRYFRVKTPLALDVLGADGAGTARPTGAIADGPMAVDQHLQTTYADTMGLRQSRPALFGVGAGVLVHQ